MKEHIILLCGVLILLICCSCFACSEKRTSYPSASAHKVPETFIKPSEISPTQNQPSSNNTDPRVPLLVNPDFTIEELPCGKIIFKRERLRMSDQAREYFIKMKKGTVTIPEQLVNRTSFETTKLPEQGKSIIWLSSYAIYAMNLDSCELWAHYYPYGDWSVESYSLAKAEYPKVLVGLSMAHLFPYNRILKIDMETGKLDGYFELPENLAGIYVLHSLGDDRYFAVSYQGDNSWRLSLLNLGNKPSVDKAIILKDLGLPSRKGYYTISDDNRIFYFNNRGLFISFDMEKFERLKVQEMNDISVKQIELVPYRNELCALSTKTVTLLDIQSFEILNSYDLPMQAALQDHVEGKSQRVLLKKGDPTYLPPSGVTYRPPTDELIITFDYSPNMLMINCNTKEQRLVKFAEESIAVGQPIYLSEERLLIGGKYIYNFKTGSAKRIVGTEGMLIDSLIHF